MKKLLSVSAVILLLIAVMPGSAEEEILWYGAEAPDFVHTELMPGHEQIEFSTIIDQRITYAEYGHNIFLTGISVAFYGDAMVTTFAVNPNGENTYGERCHAWWSYDGGKTWENNWCFESVKEDYQTSHGSLAVVNGTLYALVTATTFTGNGGTEFWIYKDETNTWEYSFYLGSFTPSSQVLQMADGNWIMGGMQFAGGALPGIAITKDGDFTKWKTVRLPRAASGFWEVGIIPQQDTIRVLIRPEQLLVDDVFGVTDKRGSVMTATSSDFGKSFSKATQSEILSSKSKIIGGVLSDGRPYAIFNMSVENPSGYLHSRDRLLIAVGDPGETRFNRMYVLHDAGHFICYPYSIEKDGYLYVAYSEILPEEDRPWGWDRMSNSNNAMLMKIPVSAIP